MYTIKTNAGWHITCDTVDELDDAVSHISSLRSTSSDPCYNLGGALSNQQSANHLTDYQKQEPSQGLNQRQQDPHYNKAQPKPDLGHFSALARTEHNAFCNQLGLTQLQQQIELDYCGQSEMGSGQIESNSAAMSNSLFTVSTKTPLYEPPTYFERARALIYEWAQSGPPVAVDIQDWCDLVEHMAQQLANILELKELNTIELNRFVALAERHGFNNSTDGETPLEAITKWLDLFVERHNQFEQQKLNIKYLEERANEFEQCNKIASGQLEKLKTELDKIKDERDAASNKSNYLQHAIDGLTNRLSEARDKVKELESELADFKTQPYHPYLNAPPNSYSVAALNVDPFKATK